MDPTESQKQEESKEEVVRDLRAQLTSTQEELTALLEKQRQLQVGVESRHQETQVINCLGTWDLSAHGSHKAEFWWFLGAGSSELGWHLS